HLAIRAGVNLQDETTGAAMMKLALDLEKTNADMVALLLREGAKFPSEQIEFIQTICKYCDSIALAEILLSMKAFPESPEDPFFEGNFPMQLRGYLLARQARILVRGRAGNRNRRTTGNQSSE